MKYVAELHEVAGLFGVQPKLEYANLPYYENVTTFEADLEHQTVWFQYMPYQAWAELRVVGKPFSVVKLLLSDISHLTIRKTEEDHGLHVRFARKQTSSLYLSLRPRLMLFWGNQGGPEEDAPALGTVENHGDASQETPSK